MRWSGISVDGANVLSARMGEFVNLVRVAVRFVVVGLAFHARLLQLGLVARRDSSRGWVAVLNYRLPFCFDVLAILRLLRTIVDAALSLSFLSRLIAVILDGYLRMRCLCWLVAHLGIPGYEYADFVLNRRWLVAVPVAVFPTKKWIGLHFASDLPVFYVAPHDDAPPMLMMANIKAKFGAILFQLHGNPDTSPKKAVAIQARPKIAMHVSGRIYP
ncbi:hypothetical protein Nepgr_032219 [Nepenthes gracilis]|uniref:Uncharacterized protein n=1 Tax=Nepenthes gracilis TaxID=150966 RepID=A0AAD3Y843_NEPGR|nr:hypothetical protein Nepgr_032219 [Nepenthes gracilis]